MCLIVLAALSPTGIALAGVGDCLDQACDTHQVPEPSSLLLLASSLGALGWVLRRLR